MRPHHGPSTLSHLECARCGRRHDADARAQLCECGAPLLARYDLERAARTMTAAALRDRPPTLWRYEELLPVRDRANRVTLHEAMTPLLPLPETGRALGLDALVVKDEGLLPTGTFKARGAAVGVSRAKELGVRAFAMPTNGNAGGAWSAYAARAGIEAHVVMPRSAPALNRWECEMYGAHLTIVDGLINDAGKIVAASVAERGYFDASTLKEPYRIEGKKTMGFELAEQLGWSAPDVVVYPTGGGVGLIGIFKALQELAAIGLVDERMPRFVAVQAEGCAPIVRAWEEHREESAPWEHAATVAFGINVPKALGDFVVLRALYETGGAAVAVSDAELLEMQALAARADGVLFCTEGGATLAAAKRLRERGWIAPEERVLLVNTGSAFKNARETDAQRDR